MKISNPVRNIFFTTLILLALPARSGLVAQDKVRQGEDKKVSRSGTETPEYVFSMGIYYYNELDYDKAISYFEKYIEMVGDEEVSLSYLGKIYLNLKNKEKALTSFQRALKLNPKNIETLSNIAEIHLNNQSLDEAIKILDAIVELDPVNERALFTLAEVYQSKKEARKTMVYYKKLTLATLKNSANIRLLNKSYTNIARYYYDVQDYEKALEYYQKIVEIVPEDFNSQYIYGELLKVNGKFRESADVMSQLLKKDSLNLEVLESVIESLFILGDYQTRAYLKTYLDNIQNANYLYQAMNMLYTNQPRKAHQYFSRVLEKNPNRISAHIGIFNSIAPDDLEEIKKEAYTIVILAQKVRSYNLAAFYMNRVFQILNKENETLKIQNKLDNAKHDVQLTADEEKLANEFIDTYYTHAISLENLEHLQQAHAYYWESLRHINNQLAILQNRNEPQVYLHSEKNLFAGEKIPGNDALDDVMQKIKSLREKKYEAMLNFNWLLTKTKNGSARNLRENIETSDQDPRAYFMNGLVVFDEAKEDKENRQKYADSKEYFQRAISLYEKNSDKKTAPANYYFYLAMTYDKLGNFDEMESLLKKSVEMEPYNSIFLNYLGYMYSVNDKNLDSALGYIKRGLEEEPENDAYLDTLGWIYFKMNRLDEALGQLLVARTLSDKKGRKDPVIDFHIAETYKKLDNKNQAIRFYKSALENIKHASEPMDENLIRTEIQNLSTGTK